MLRPRDLLQLMKAKEMHGPVDEEVFDRTVRSAVKDVVDEQVRVGVDVPGDGEMGRMGFMRYIYQRLGGIEPREPGPNEDIRATRYTEMNQYPEYFELHDRGFRYWWMDREVDISELPNVYGNFERFRVTEPLHYRGQEAIQKEITTLKASLKGHYVADAFMTATVPAIAAGATRGVEDHYESFEAFMYAIADACHEEYKAVADAGFILQVDFPNILRQNWLQEKNPTPEQEEVRKSAELGIEALNHALRGIPEESVRFHYCSGSGLQPHTSNPSYRDIAHLILKVKAQAYGIEGASARHEHEWMVWKDIKLPEGKILIPGMIAQNHQVVEHPELVAWRIENFASVVGKENVIAGVDCGFSQFWDARRTTPEVQWAKLQSLVEGAAIASRKLWNN
jgi:5-methyltetrahydropteroyltriglutamate--homocysteine methyltransferase